MSSASRARRIGLAVLAAAFVSSAASAALAFPVEGQKPLKITKIGPPKVADDPVLASVLAGAHRPAKDVARDGARHPMESLTFWGLRPGQTVIEYSPGGGYWTQILAPYLAKTGGHYIATGADGDAPEASERAKKSQAAFKAKFSDATLYGQWTYAGAGLKSGPWAPAGSADLVLTARNIHNLLWTPALLQKTLADAYAALKPGGILAIEEHRADPRPQVGDARDGYVATSTVIKVAQDAGFVFDAASEVNANPKDTKDHPFGVWTLPPERQSAPDDKPADPNFDRAKYDAIGESDRMTLRFRKPG
jgi:predicted methyltransferase